MPSTVRCYDCNEYVPNLRMHRTNCKNSRKKINKSNVKCYDCGEFVPNIHQHRQTCSQSRKEKSKITSVNSSGLNTDFETKELIKNTTTMFVLFIYVDRVSHYDTLYDTIHPTIHQIKKLFQKLC